MPKIQAYNQRTEAPGPMQTRRVSGEDMGGGLGRATAQAGQAIQQVGDQIYKRQEQNELNDATARFAKFQADKTNELQKGLRDGTINPEEFMNKVDEELGEMSGEYSSAGGREYFDKASASLKSHFTVSAMSAGAEIAGVKAVSSLEQELSNRSSAVMKDPSSYQTSLDMSLDSIDARVQAGQLPFKAAEQLKQKARGEYAQAAVRGWAELDPDDAEAQIKQGLWDQALSADQKKQMLGEISSHKHAKKVEKAFLESQQEKAKNQAQQATMNNMLTSFYENKLTPQDVVKDPTLDFGQKRQILNMIETESAGNKIKTDSSVYLDLYDRIHLQDGDPKKITSEDEINAKFGRGLDKDALKFLRDEFQGRDTEEGQTIAAMKKQVFEQAKATLVKTNPMLGIRDANGEENLARFTYQFNRDYKEGIKAGKSPMSLLNPDSADYIGKSIKSFQKSPQELMRSSTQSFGAKPPDPAKAKQPNESPADYLKRMKGENK